MGYRDGIIAAMTVFLGLNTVALGARVYVRTRMLTRGFGWDDAVLCLSYLAEVLMCGMGFTAMYFGFAAEDVQPYYNTAKANQFYYANQLLLYIGAGLIKIAVALVLLHLATNNVLRWVLGGSMLVVVVWTVVMTMYSSWLCASSGSSNYAGSATCSFVGMFRTITNIFLDYFFALLPIAMLWNVKMESKVKASVLFLLGLGIVASSATIAKLVIIVKLQTASASEAVGLHYDLLLWADIELGLSILTTSAVALRPLLSLIPGLASTRNGTTTDASTAIRPYEQIEVERGRYELKDVDKHNPRSPISEKRSTIYADGKDPWAAARADDASSEERV